MPSIQCDNIFKVAWLVPTDDSFSITGSVHIWRIQLSTYPHLIESAELLLSRDERIRAASYPQEKNRHRFILSHGILRMILAKYVDEQPESILFTASESKKPYLTSKTDLHFNVSHAGDWVLIIISGSPVGTDIEHINPDFDYTEVLPVCFSDAETKYVENREQFYQLWTRKEALVKATGKGIDNDLSFVPCMDGTDEAMQSKIGSDKNWMVSSFEVAEKYIASVAYDPLIQNVFFYDISEPMLRYNP